MGTHTSNMLVRSGLNLLEEFSCPPNGAGADALPSHPSVRWNGVADGEVRFHQRRPGKDNDFMALRIFGLKGP